MADKYNFVMPPAHWENAAKSDAVYGAICAGWDRHRFETDRTSLFFSADCPLDAVVVDLGCGIGRVARFVAPLVRRYIGLDYAQAMVERARQYNAGLANVEFVHAATLTVLPSESVDLIFSEQVFFHLTREQQLRYLAEGWGVLRPGGLFLAVVPLADHYVDGFTPQELRGLLPQYQVSSDVRSKTFDLYARKPT